MTRLEDYLAADVGKTLARAGSTLQTNLAAEYKLDEDTDTAYANRQDAKGGSAFFNTGAHNETTGVVGNAIPFDGSQELYIHDADAWRFGDETVAFRLWLKLSSKLSDQTVLAKWDAGSLEYRLWYDTSADRIKWSVTNDGSSVTTVAADSHGAVSTGAWMRVYFGHDADSNEIFVKVDDGAIDTTAHSGGIHSGTSLVYLGSRGGSEYLDGTVDEIAMWSRLLTDDEHAYDYNLGSGRSITAKTTVSSLASGVEPIIPQNCGAFYDGTRYWIFYADTTTTLKCLFGTSLDSLSATGGNLITGLGNDGKTWSCVFGQVGATWYVWVAADIMYRWELTASGLANGTSAGVSASHKGVRLAHDYGSATVSELYRTYQEVGTGAQRSISADLTGDADETGWDAPGSYPEHTLMAKLSDGYLNLAINDGDTGGSSSGAGAWERTKTNLGDAWSADSSELGFTDQKHASGVSHTGQEDLCQLDDGTIYAAHLDGTAEKGVYGKIVLKVRGNTVAGTWSTVSSDVRGDSGTAYAVCLSTDGTDVWAIYCAGGANGRGDIYYRKYDVVAGTFGTETLAASISDGAVFTRMSTQWRFAGGVIPVTYNEIDLDGTRHLQVAEIAV